MKIRVALPAALAVALGAPFCFQRVFDTDAGWHIAVGRLIGAGHFPRTNALSWIAPAEPWYPTSWLYDLLAAAGADALPGALGPQLLTFALFAVFAALLALACAREDPERGAWIAPAVAVLSVPRLVPRPQVASWAALAAALLSGPSSTAARAAGVAMVAVAGNLHSGAAFAAFVLALFCLEAFARTRRPVELFLAAGCGLALFANPGAAFNLRYLGLHLHVDEVVRLVEFERPRLLAEAVFYALLPVALLLSLWRIRERPALFAATIVFAVLGLRAQRMTSEFVIVAAPTLAAGLAALARRSERRAASLAAVLLFVACAANRRMDRWLGLDLAPAWDPHRLPVRAARFVSDHGLSGPHFNSFSDGGYLEYALPALPAFLDGRVQAYPPGLFRELEEAEKGRASFDAFLRARGVEWAITTRIRERLGGYRLIDPRGWALVYWDDANELWLRRDVARLQPLAQALEYRHFRPYGSIVGSVAQLPAADLPSLWSELDRFERTSPSDPYALIVRCAAAVRMARPDAPPICAAAKDRAPSPEARALAERASALPSK